MDNSHKEDPYHMGYYAGRGFLYIGLLGGASLWIQIWLAYALDHPLMHEMQVEEYAGALPGMLMMFGPIIGCCYYMLITNRHFRRLARLPASASLARASRTAEQTYNRYLICIIVWHLCGILFLIPMFGVLALHIAVLVPGIPVLIIRLTAKRFERWPTVVLNAMLLLDFPAGTVLAIYGFACLKWQGIA